MAKKVKCPLYGHVYTFNCPCASGVHHTILRILSILATVVNLV